MKKGTKEMKSEYDFTGQKAVRGKYAKAYKAGHSVKVYKGEKLLSDEYFAAIAPDVREYFPDSRSINSTLRKLITMVPDKPRRVQK